MAAQTLAQLRTSIRERSDQTDSQFVSDTELLEYINQSYHELYDLIVKTVEDYYIIKYSFTISSGNVFDLTTLTVPFYKLRGIDQYFGSKWIEIHPIPFGERNYYNNSISIFSRFRGPKVVYRLLGNLLYIFPEERAQGTYQMWYVPRLVELVSDSDALDVNCNEYREYIIASAAAKMLSKEESDPSIQLASVEATVRRINEIASDRDQGEPEKITDVHRSYFDNEY